MRLRYLLALVGLVALLAPAALAADGGEPAAKQAAPDAGEAKQAAPDAGEAKPAAPGEGAGGALTPEERIRRATVSPPGKECDIPDEESDEVKRARTQLVSEVSRVTVETLTEAVFTTDAFWAGRAKGLFAEVQTTLESWESNNMRDRTEPPDFGRGITSGLVQQCREHAARDPKGCKVFGDDAFNCIAWTSVWKRSSETKNCDGLVDELVPVCRMIISQKLADCASGTERARQLCEFIAQANTTDWAECDDPGQFQRCLSMTLALSTRLGAAACDPMMVGKPADAPRKVVQEMCQAVLAGKPERCPGSDTLNLIEGQREPLVRVRVLGGGEQPRLYVVGASEQPVICHADVKVSDGGAAQHIDFTLTLGGAVRQYPAIPLPLSLDPFKATADVSTVCVPTVGWHAAN